MGFFTDKLKEDSGVTPEPDLAAPTTVEAAGEPAGRNFFTQKLSQNPEVAADNKSSITADTPWSDVLKQGAGNFLSDIPQTAGEIATGIGRTIRHPVATAEGLGTIGKGTYDYLSGNQTPEADIAKGLGNQLYHDYGTEAGWKEAVANRPFSRALDVGTAMIAPEYAAEKMGATGVARGLAMANPTNWVTGAGRAVLKTDAALFNHVIGHFGTHTGNETMALAMEAGSKGGEASKAFRNAQKGIGDPTEAVDAFQGAVDDVWSAAKDKYQTGMTDVGRDKQQLAITPALQALQDADVEFSKLPEEASKPIMAGQRYDLDTGTPLSPIPGMPSLEASQTQGTRNAIRQMLVRWDATGTARNQELTEIGLSDTPLRGSGMNEFYTPSGLDQLKKNLQVIRDGGKDSWNVVHPGVESNSKDAVVINRVLAALRKEIKTNSPKYAETMQGYEDAYDALNAYKKELSLGPNGNPGTALRKLLSSLRNNVLANFGYRSKLVKELAENPAAKNALYSLAGQSLSATWPRGLTGAFASSLLGEGALGLITSHFAGPLGWAAIPAHMAMQSPYLMGRMAHGLGTAGRYASKVPWRPIVGTMANFGGDTHHNGLLDYGSMPPWGQLNPALDAAQNESPYN